MAAHESNDDTFHERCQGIIHKIELTQENLLPQAFDQLRSQVVSSLNDTYSKMADDLIKSKSKLAKAVGTGAKIADMVNKAYSAVQKGLKIANAVSALVQLVNVEESYSTSDVHTVDETLVDRELNDIKECLKEIIQKQLQQKLKGALESIVKGSLEKVAEAGKEGVKAGVQKTFNGRTSSQVVRDLQLKRQQQNTASDYGDKSHGEVPTSPGSTTPTKPTTQAQKKKQAYEERRETFQHTVAKPKPKEYVTDVEKSTVQAALQSSGSSKLPKGHGHHQDNLASKYSYERGTELERMPPRPRANNQGHLHVPGTELDQEQNRPKLRATNAPMEKVPETKQPSAPRQGQGRETNISLDAIQMGTKGVGAGKQQKGIGKGSAEKHSPVPTASAHFAQQDKDTSKAYPSQVQKVTENKDKSKPPQPHKKDPTSTCQSQTHVDNTAKGGHNIPPSNVKKNIVTDNTSKPPGNKEAASSIQGKPKSSQKTKEDMEGEHQASKPQLNGATKTGTDSEQKSKPLSSQVKEESVSQKPKVKRDTSVPSKSQPQDTASSLSNKPQLKGTTKTGTDSEQKSKPLSSQVKEESVSQKPKEKTDATSGVPSKSQPQDTASSLSSNTEAEYDGEELPVELHPPVPVPTKYSSRKYTIPYMGSYVQREGVKPKNVEPSSQVKDNGVGQHNIQADPDVKQ